MMKRLMPTLFGFLICMSVSFAGYSDGFITAGEYEYGVEWFTDNPPLIVEGGGADVIDMWDYSRLEVHSTSIPVNGNWYTGGIRDIRLADDSKLLYLGGYTDILTIGANTTSILKGGSINSIRALRCSLAEKQIDIYSQVGWSWISNNPLLGIQGQWWDGSPFNISFINVANYDPVWMNINVITPEPSTLVLLGVGGLLLRKRK
jgi:hypothetical protein